MQCVSFLPILQSAVKRGVCVGKLDHSTRSAITRSLISRLFWRLAKGHDQRRPTISDSKWGNRSRSNE